MKTETKRYQVFNREGGRNMTVTKRYVLEPESVARCTPWMQTAKRLKEEHDQLLEQLADLQSTAKSIYEETDCNRGRVTLNILKLRMGDYMRKLHDHSVWEEKEVFPVIELYFRRQMKPSITPSIWVMEKDHELADLFAQSFVEAVEALPETTALEQNRQAAAHLVQACLILTEHFELEEELIFPLADEMLTDIDYFYS